MILLYHRGAECKVSMTNKVIMTTFMGKDGDCRSFPAKDGCFFFIKILALHSDKLMKILDSIT